MMKSTIWSLLGLLAILSAMILAAGCSQSPGVAVGDAQPDANLAAMPAGEADDGDVGEDGEDDDENIPLDEVPDHVRKAAEGAVPGLVLAAAEREHENGAVIYSLAGTAAGVEYEVEVSPSGEVLQIEQEDEDD